MKKVWSHIFVICMYVLLYAPLLVMVFFSFNESRSTSVFTGFSLKWYREVFSTRDTMQALENTLLLSIASALIATVMGTAAAVYMFYVRRKAWKTTLKTVTNIPMMNPEIVTGVSLMLLFVFAGRLLGLKNALSFWTLLIAHVTFNLPYVILNVLPKLNQTDPHLSEAAQDLGAKPLRAFFGVIFPAIVPGIFSGFLMSFTMSLDDFVISYYTTGADFQTLPLKIFSMTKRTVKPDMYALSSLIFFTVLALLLTINLLQIRQEKKQKNDR